VEKRLAVIGIALENRTDSASAVNETLSSYGELIVGRLGVPYKDRGVSIIAVIVDGTNDEIGALAGKVGKIKGVKAKVALMY
jgi:putative iron-only hydrogenase system regulator